MVSDALQGDRLITMVLSKVVTGLDDSCPPIFDVGCIGRIVHHEALPDGRSNLILKGLRRVRIDAEIDTERMYRSAQVSVLEERSAREDACESVDNVFQAFTEMLKMVGRASDVRKISFSRELPAAQFCDLAAHCLNFDILVKQSLLEELDVDRRL